ncbi:MAG: translesion DNA synthesis-associated protein ImuA [Pseudomonadota bacterium]
MTNVDVNADVNTDGIEEFLQQQDKALASKVWRGKQKNHPAQGAQRKVLATGYNTLDKLLHDGGWPLATTTELGLSQAGIGELRLLTPALRELQSNSWQRNIIWIAPPFLPFAPALEKEQIDIRQLTIVQTNCIQDTLWAAEQALLAECCAAVMTWTGSYNLSTRELRRLQLAAEKTNTWNIVLRHSDCLQQSSTAGLRLHIKANSFSQLDLHILKQPHGWGEQRCTLSLQPHYENWQRLPANLLPNNNRIQDPVLPEQVNNLSNTDHLQASVTVLSSLAALRTVH